MSKESDNKAIIGRWFDTAPNFEAETTEAPVRFHDWIDYRSSTPERQGPRQNLIRRGQAARFQALDDLGGAVLRALQATAGGGTAVIAPLPRRFSPRPANGGAPTWSDAHATRRCASFMHSMTACSGTLG